jgi:ABC-type multidrug transport system ATPase subunit
MSVDEPILRVSDLRLVRSGRIIFDGVNFELRCGDLLLLIGNNGSGKTSLLDCICGFERASGGVVGITPKPVSRVFQHRCAFWNMTVRENVALASWADATLRKEARRLFGRAGPVPARVDQLIDQLLLSEYRDQSPAVLSGGQLQRLKLAMALAHGTDLILVDEPFTDLDTRSVELMTQMLLETRKVGAIVVVSHRVVTELNPIEVYELPDRTARTEPLLSWRAKPSFSRRCVL